MLANLTNCFIVCLYFILLRRLILIKFGTVMQITICRCHSSETPVRYFFSLQLTSFQFTGQHISRSIGQRFTFAIAVSCGATALFL